MPGESYNGLIWLFWCYKFVTPHKYEVSNLQCVENIKHGKTVKNKWILHTPFDWVWLNSAWGLGREKMADLKPCFLTRWQHWLEAAMKLVPRLGGIRTFCLQEYLIVKALYPGTTQSSVNQDCPKAFPKPWGVTGSMNSIDWCPSSSGKHSRPPWWLAVNGEEELAGQATIP